MIKDRQPIKKEGKNNLRRDPPKEGRKRENIQCFQKIFLIIIICRILEIIYGKSSSSSFSSATQPLLPLGLAMNMIYQKAPLSNGLPFRCTGSLMM